MIEHDELCPVCRPLRQARADERERVAAICRMLLDSGDITPAGVRVLTGGTGR